MTVLAPLITYESYPFGLVFLADNSHCPIFNLSHAENENRSECASMITRVIITHFR